VQPGDRFLLCSDGLVDEVTDAHIADILTANEVPTDAATALVLAANDLGGRDNITVVVVDVLPIDADAVQSEPVSSPSVPNGMTPQMSGSTTTDTARKNKHTFAYTLAAVFIVVALLTTVTVVGVYARSGYFIGENDDKVITVYRGRVGGVWWFHPTVELESELQLTDVPVGVVREVRANRAFSSLAEAQQYLELVTVAVNATTTTVAPTDTTDSLTTTTTIG
jgi:phosphatidate phosphatase APP1